MATRPCASVAPVRRSTPDTRPAISFRTGPAPSGMGTVDLARDCLRNANQSVSGMSAGQIIERALHSTSDFPLILGDSLGRILRGALRSASPVSKMVGRQTTARDFKSKHALQLSEAPRLEKVGESGEFRSGSLAEARESYKLSTFGRVIGVTRQAIGVNDDLGAISRGAWVSRNRDEASSRRPLDQQLRQRADDVGHEGACLHRA